MGQVDFSNATKESVILSPSPDICWRAGDIQEATTGGPFHRTRALLVKIARDALAKTERRDCAFAENLPMLASQRRLEWIRRGGGG